MNKEIDADTLKRWITEKKDLELIDVRMPFEYKFRHIENSKSIPLKELGNRISEIDNTKTVVFICQSGGRSCVACDIAKEKGIESYNLKDGLMGFL